MAIEVLGIDQPLVIGKAKFDPGVEKDKWDNIISRITVPSDTYYTIVHYATKSWRLNSAAVYFGRNQFVRFSATNSDNDLVADTATIYTAIGDFYVWWGDGDYGGLTYPAIIDSYPELKKTAVSINKRLGEIYQGSGERAAFILLAMQLLDEIDTANIVPTVWLDKEAWESKKKQLQEQRNQRRYG